MKKEEINKTTIMNSFNLLYPEQSDIKFSTILFPDGQPHVKIDTPSIATIDKKLPLTIITRITNANDLLLLLFVKNALDYLEFERIELKIAYLLAARMDRVMLSGEPFSLKVVSAMLNQANFKKVFIFDPHSEVSTALIERSYAITNHQYVQEALENYFHTYGSQNFCLVSPDAGALKKIHYLAQYIKADNIVECMKERDVRTGALTNFKIATNDLHHQTCFIIDDICDGGGTFAGTAKMLKEKGAGKVVLIVSHGIFSKGIKIDFVDEIYTTDSYKYIDHIHCFPVGRYL